MRWRQAARDLEDPEIAAVTDADAEHLERAMTLRHYQQQPGTSSSSSRRGRESKRATPSASAASGNADADASCSLSSPFFHQRGGRHGLLPPPPWEVVVRDIERDRRSNSGDTTGEFAHQWSTQLSSSATMASSPSIESGDDEEDEEEDEEEGAEAEDALESAKLLLAGGVAGAVSKTATAPLARLTILYQVQGMTAAAASRGGGAVSAAATSTSAASAAVSPIAGLPLRQALRAVVEREGVASLWRGNFVTVLHRLPYSAVNFWAYERLSEAWIAAEDKRSESSGENSGGEASTSTSDTSRRLACGGAAGMAACTLAYPLDLVRTRLAASSSPAFSVGGGGGGSSGGLAASAAKNKRSNHPHPPRLSVARTLADVVRADGPRGLYRGLGATLAQVGPSLALNYTAYGALRAKWMSGKQPGEPPTVRKIKFFFSPRRRDALKTAFFSHFFVPHPRFPTFYKNKIQKKRRPDNDVPCLRRRSGPHQFHRYFPSRPHQAEDAARWRSESGFLLLGLFGRGEAATPDVRRSRPGRSRSGRTRGLLRGHHARVL